MAPELGLGALNLPVEVLSRILFFAVRPDCMHRMQCDKVHEHNDISETQRCDILVLSSAMCNRVLPIFQKCHTRVSDISYRRHSSWSEVAGITLYTVPRILIVLDLPEYTNNEPLKQFTGMVRRIRQVVKILKARKSSIIQVEILLNRDLPHCAFDPLLLAKNNKDHGFEPKDKITSRICNVLVDLVMAVSSKGGDVVLGRNLEGYTDDEASHDDEPMVAWLLQTAFQKGVVVERLLDSKVDNPSDGTDGTREEDPEVVDGLLERDIVAGSVNGLPAGPRKPIFDCSECRKVFDDASALARHLCHKCDCCGTIFGTGNALNNHSRNKLKSELFWEKTHPAWW